VPARNVDVWLPDGYDGRRKYAVLYMHDGQMLFDSTTTWNRQEWGVDEVVGRLLREKRIRDCIVVGVWNSGERRHSEYFPQAAFESLTEKEKHDILAAGRANGQPVFTKNAIASDDYLRFRDRCVEAGIGVSIVPGILPITRFPQVTRFAARCGARIPDWLAERFAGLDDDPETRRLIAANVAIEQVSRLRRHGDPTRSRAGPSASVPSRRAWRQA
jgi:hypothetical protein